MYNLYMHGSHQAHEIQISFVVTSYHCLVRKKNALMRITYIPQTIITLVLSQIKHSTSLFRFSCNLAREEFTRAIYVKHRGV